MDKITEYGVLPQNTYNMDEKGFMIGKLGKMKRIFNRDLYQQGKLLGAGQDGNRTWITFIACICQDLTALPPFLVYPGAEGNFQDCWVKDFKPDQQDGYFTSLLSGWTNDKLGLEWLAIFDRLTKRKARTRY